VRCASSILVIESKSHETEAAVLLRVFVHEDDRWGERPLYEAIVFKAREMQLAGATVLRGPIGFRRSGRVHTATLWHLSFDLPVVIEIVDTQNHVDRFLTVSLRHDVQRNCDTRESENPAVRSIARSTSRPVTGYLCRLTYSHGAATEAKAPLRGGTRAAEITLGLNEVPAALARVCPSEVPIGRWPRFMGACHVSGGTGNSVFWVQSLTWPDCPS
jgi:uncharacterized protein